MAIHRCVVAGDTSLVSALRQSLGPSGPDLEAALDGESELTADSYFAENVAMAEASLGNLEVDPEVGDYSAAATGGTPNYQVGNGDCMGGYATPSGEEVWTEGWTAFPL